MSTQLVLQPGSAGEDTLLINGSSSDINWGSDESVVIGTSSAAKGSIKFRYLLRFDVGDLPAGAVVIGARLILSKILSGHPEGEPFFVHRVTRPDWTEFGATWTRYDGMNDWDTPGGDFDSTPIAQLALGVADVELEFEPLSEPVKDAIEQHEGQLDLLVVGNETELNRTVILHSSDSTLAAARPKLIVDYVPVPELQLTDNADGSGATATVSGADTTAVTTVYVRSFDGESSGGTWTAAGTVNGNDTLPVDLPPGHYFGYAASAADGVQVVSGVVYFVVTDGAESLHTRCLDAVQARIRLLGLEGMASDHVVIEKLPAARNLAESLGLPAIVISPQRAAMPAADGTNGLDDVHYDILVGIFDVDNQEPTLEANLDRYLLWRQQIARAFRNQRLPSVPEVINSEVEPTDGLPFEAWQRQLMACALKLRFTCREPRGF